MSIYRREIDTQCCTAWMHGIRTINGQYPDDNRDFDINAGNGIRIEPATGGITIINDSAASSFIAGDNIDITPSGDDLVIGLVSDPHINGDLEVDGTTTLNDTLQVNGDIIQNGSAYETHAEKVYTTNDYIVTRNGAVSALSPGDYSGFQVKKYDGTNDGRLVIDNSGVARVGDVGDEQPLLTRDESANMSNGALLTWDNTDQRAETLTGNVGSDTKPIKIVSGVTSPVTHELLTTDTNQNITATKMFDKIGIDQRSLTPGDNFTGNIFRQSDNANDIYRFRVNGVQGSAEIRLSINKTTGTATLHLWKDVGGTQTQIQIAQL